MYSKAFLLFFFPSRGALVAGLGFLAAIFSAAIAPASISTAIATAIASLHLKALFIFQKQKKQKKTRPLRCTI
jgi:putative effector of murein hydrolase LrgA (UPF0299 family)